MLAANPPLPLEAQIVTALLMMAGGVAVSLLVFLLMREIWCWYWKINAAVGELKMIRGLLETISEQQAAQLKIARSSTTAPDGGKPETWASGVFRP